MKSDLIPWPTLSPPNGECYFYDDIACSDTWRSFIVEMKRLDLKAQRGIVVLGPATINGSKIHRFSQIIHKELGFPTSISVMETRGVNTSKKEALVSSFFADHLLFICHQCGLEVRS